MAAGLSSVVFLALVSLSPCLAQRLDKGDFTVNEATGLLESPSRRPRALAFPKDSQLLVRTKTVVKDRRRLMNRYRGGIVQVVLFFFLSIVLEGKFQTIPVFSFSLSFVARSKMIPWKVHAILEISWIRVFFFSLFIIGG